MAWRLIGDIRKLKAGDSVRVNHGPAFRIQKVIGGRGFSLEVITDQGHPLEIRDTDEVTRLEEE